MLKRVGEAMEEFIDLHPEGGDDPGVQFYEMLILFTPSPHRGGSRRRGEQRSASSKGSDAPTAPEHIRVSAQARDHFGGPIRDRGRLAGAAHGPRIARNDYFHGARSTAARLATRGKGREGFHAVCDTTASTTTDDKATPRLSADFSGPFLDRADGLQDLGSTVTIFVLPLLIYRLTGSALNLGIATSLNFSPALPAVRPRVLARGSIASIAAA